MNKPHITIKNNPQKSNYKFSDVLNNDILSDVCKRMTGKSDYTVSFDDTGYNKGRLVLIEYNGTINYISLSEHNKVEGRNSFFQSLTTALISYYSDTHVNKQIAFYFLPSITGHFDGAYFQFMYRLMATNGVKFINADTFVNCSLSAFTTIEDLMAARSLNRNQNSSNNSTYITRDTKNSIQIYCKTYGASKKESTLLSLAASRLTKYVQLYEICEGNLTKLPEPDRNALQQLGNVDIISTNRTMERKVLLETEKTFRSPMFTYNLLRKFQGKECAFCDCKIPEIIEGAHILPVADIKRADELSDEEKIDMSIDGENGLWLCCNHHKMFDDNIISISDSGKIIFDNRLNVDYQPFIRKSTTKDSIPAFAFTAGFARYLYLRNRSMAV